MKRLAYAIAIAAACAAVPAHAGNVNVAVNIGQPGYYGRIEIGNYPPPQVIYPQPVIIQQAPAYPPAPLYLRVPPGHARHWARHCGAYNACGQQVYFVQDRWYNDVYAPRYRQDYERGRGYERHERHERNEDRGHGEHRGHRGD